MRTPDPVPLSDAPATERAFVLHRERLLLAPPSIHRWWRSHAAIPTVLPLSDHHWRVYFSARAEADRSHIIYADFDPSQGMKLISLHDEPLLELGALGSFDQAGMLPCSVVRIGDRVHLYYIGVSLRRDVPAQVAIGLAISDDDGASFRRAFSGPVLSTGPEDPLFVTAGQVLALDGGYRMWYASGTRWLEVDGRPECSYKIRQAVSRDGLRWSAERTAAIELASDEHSVARPWVFTDGTSFHMVYCQRGNEGFRGPSEAAYRFGYAWSKNGADWSRDDSKLVFESTTAEGDWDSWMQAYPCIVRHRDEWIMFYNGNGFGQSGFGYARFRLPTPRSANTSATERITPLAR